MNRRTTDMGTAPIGPLLLRMSIPGMVSMIVMSLYNIVDTIWVSGLPNGTESIAALTVVMSLGMGAMALGMGAGSGVTSLVSRRFGESKLDKVLNGFEGKDCHIVCGLQSNNRTSQRISMRIILGRTNHRKESGYYEDHRY